MPAQTLQDISGLEFFDTDEANERFWAAFVARLGNGRVFRHGVATDDGILIGDLSVESGVMPTNIQRHSLLRAQSIGRYRTLAGPAVAVNSAYAGNYYHWMLEVLPRLALLRLYDPRLLSERPLILVESWGQAFQRETIEWVGIDPNQVRAVDRTSYRVADLVVPSLAGQSFHPPPWAVSSIGEMFSPARTQLGEGLPNRRLFVSRAGQTRRRIRNEDALAAALCREGFEVIDPEMMTVEDQARLFRAAALVVAPHGAALTNLIFCRPGTHVIELFSPAYRPPCYFLISRHRRLYYTPLVGRPWSPEPLRISLEVDLEVDVDAVMRILPG